MAVSPLDLAIVLSAIDNMSTMLGDVQQKTAALVTTGGRMPAPGEKMTAAGGIAGAWSLSLGNAIGAAMQLQNEVARVATLLAPTAPRMRQLAGLQQFALAPSQRHSYAAEQIAESACIGVSRPGIAPQAVNATIAMEKVAVVTHAERADIMRTPGTLDLGGWTERARRELQRLGDAMITRPAQLAFQNMREITGAPQYATAAASQLHMPHDTALVGRGRFSAAGLRGAQTGTAFKEMASTIGRGTFDKLTVLAAHTNGGLLDVSGTLNNLAHSIRAHPTFEEAGKLNKALGFRGARSELLVQQLGRLDQARQVLAHPRWDRLSSLSSSNLPERAGSQARSAHRVANSVTGFFIGHSEIPQGPLHRVNLLREIAMSSRPAPVQFARCAAAIAPGIAPAPAAAAPIITVNYSPNITGASPGDWVNAARRHADELVRIIEGKQARRTRLSFA
jgi:hypothetical protein